LRPSTPRPIKPVPSSISVAGSGVARGAPLVEAPPSLEATAVEVKPELLLLVAGLSDAGQPIIPKNIITTHNTINNFFISFPLFYKNVNIIISSLALS
jgi:hypothetical protein